MSFRSHGKECSGCKDVGGEDAASSVVAPMANVSFEADQEEVEGEEEVEKVEEADHEEGGQEAVEVEEHCSVAGHANAQLEADAVDADSDVEELWTVEIEPEEQGPSAGPANADLVPDGQAHQQESAAHKHGTLVLVQTKSEYKWPGLVVGSNGTQLTVQLFDKPGLKGQRRSFEASAVEVFQYSRELDDMVQTTTNNELKNAYKKALDIVYSSD